jgi:hypothetical protein
MIVLAPIMFETDFLKVIAARSLLPAPPGNREVLPNSSLSLPGGYSG